MGYTTSISDYELERGDGSEPCEGYEGDGDDSDSEHVSGTRAKVVTPEKKKKPHVTTTAVVKDAKAK